MSDEETHDHGAILALICNHALTRERPVNLIYHGTDDTWDFSCGQEDGHESADDLSAVCLGCAFEAFVNGVSQDDLPEGYAADRPDDNKRWIIRPMTAEELSDEEE